MYVRYAMQNQEAEPGTQLVEPVRRVRHRVLEQEPQHPGLVDAGVWLDVHQPDQSGRGTGCSSDQPLNGDAQPTLYMNPTTPVRLQGYQIAFPGYLPWSPGQRHSVRRTAEAAAVLSGSDLAQGQARLPLRRFLRAHRGRSHVRRLLRTPSRRSTPTSAALPSLDNFVLGQTRAFPDGDQPGGLSRRHVRDAGAACRASPASTATTSSRCTRTTTGASATGSTVNLGVRYEYYGPQTKSEPKYDSNFYYGDPNVVGEHQHARRRSSQSVATGTALPSATRARSATLWKPDRNNWAPRLGFAWDVERRRQDERARRLRHRATSATSATSPTTCCSIRRSTWWRPSTPPADVRDDADLRRQRRPVRRRRRRDQDDPARQPAPRRPEHRDGLRALLRPVGTSTRSPRNVVAKVEYHGIDRAQAVRSGRPQQARCGARLPGRRRPPLRARTPQYTAFNTRGNRGRSQYHGVLFSLESRRVGEHRPAVQRRRTRSGTRRTT